MTIKFDAIGYAQQLRWVSALFFSLIIPILLKTFWPGLLA